MGSTNKAQYVTMKTPIFGKELKVSLLAASLIPSASSSSTNQRANNGAKSSSKHQQLLVTKPTSKISLNRKCRSFTKKSRILNSQPRNESFKSCYYTSSESQFSDTQSQISISLASRSVETESSKSITPDRQSLKTSSSRSQSPASNKCDSPQTSFYLSSSRSPKTTILKSMSVKMKTLAIRSPKPRPRSSNKSLIYKSKSPRTRPPTKFVRKPVLKKISASNSRKLILTKRKSPITISLLSKSRLSEYHWSRSSCSLYHHSNHSQISFTKSSKLISLVSKSRKSVPRTSSRRLLSTTHRYPRTLTHKYTKSPARKRRSIKRKSRRSSSPFSLNFTPLRKLSPLCLKAKIYPSRSASYMINSRTRLKPHYSISRHSNYKLRKERKISRDKSKQYMESMLAQNVDVRYITELKNYLDQIMENFKCSASICPTLQERLYQHRMEHHPGCSEQERDKISEDKKGTAVQTKLTLATFGNLTISIEHTPTSTNTSDPSVIHPSIVDKSGDKPAALNILNELEKKYKLDIENEIRHWAKKIPINDDSPESLQAKEDCLQNLKNELLESENTNRSENFEVTIKNAIDRYLDSIDIWYPGSESDHATFKKGLREYLYKKVYDVNQNYYEAKKNLDSEIRDPKEETEKFSVRNRRFEESNASSSSPTVGENEKNLSSMTINKNEKLGDTYDPTKDGNSKLVPNIDTYDNSGPNALNNQRHLNNSSSFNFNAKQNRRVNLITPENDIIENQNHDMNKNETSTNENHILLNNQPNIPIKQNYLPNTQSNGKSNLNNGKNINNNLNRSNNYDLVNNLPLKYRQKSKQMIHGLHKNINQTKQPDQNNGKQNFELIQSTLNEPNKTDKERNYEPDRNNLPLKYRQKSNEMIHGLHKNINQTKEPDQNNGKQNFELFQSTLNEPNKTDKERNYEPDRNNLPLKYRQKSNQMIHGLHKNINQTKEPDLNNGKQNFELIKSTLNEPNKTDKERNYEPDRNLSFSKGPYYNDKKPSNETNEKSHRPKKYDTEQNDRTSQNINLVNDGLHKSDRYQNYELYENKVPTYKYDKEQDLNNGPTKNDREQNYQSSKSIIPANGHDQKYKDRNSEISKKTHEPNKYDIVKNNGLTDPPNFNSIIQKVFEKNGTNKNIIPSNNKKEKIYGPNESTTERKAPNSILKNSRDKINISNETDKGRNNESYVAFRSNQQSKTNGFKYFEPNDLNRSYYKPEKSDGTQNCELNKSMTQHVGLSQNINQHFITNENLYSNLAPNTNYGWSRDTSQNLASVQNKDQNFGAKKYYLLNREGSFNIKIRREHKDDSSYGSNSNLKTGPNLVKGVNPSNGSKRGKAISLGNYDERNDINDMTSSSNFRETYKHFEPNLRYKLYDCGLDKVENDNINIKRSYVIRTNDYMEKETTGVDTNYDNNEYNYSCSDLFENYKEIIKKKYAPGAAYSDPGSKCIVQSEESDDLLLSLSDEVPKTKRSYFHLKVGDMEKEIADWLKKFTFREADTILDRKEIIDTLLVHLVPYLSQPTDMLNKAALKASIICVLERLELCENSSQNMKTYTFANKLASKVIRVVSKFKCSDEGSLKCAVNNCRLKGLKQNLKQICTGSNEVFRDYFEHDLWQEINKCLQNTKLANDRRMKEDIVNLIVKKIEQSKNLDSDVKNHIANIIGNTYKLSEFEILNIVKNILQTSNKIIIKFNNLNNRSQFKSSTFLPGTLAIYTSEHDFRPSFDVITSTPKKKKTKSRISPEEQEYTDKVIAAIKEWIKCAPDQFSVIKSNDFDDAMINDLAFEIVERQKLGQIISYPGLSDSIYVKFSIYKWLMKFEVFELEDLNDVAGPYTKSLIESIQRINVPNLAKPYHGTRQEMKTRQFKDVSLNWSEPFIPEAKDILEDEISIWLHEYPSEIYLTENISVQNKLVHEFAEEIQPKLIDKKPDSEISEEIKKWLNRILKSKEKGRVENMTDSLVKRINQLPQDKTIDEDIKKKKESRKEIIESKNKVALSTPKSPQVEMDNTMIKFVEKYIEHHYNAEDPLTKGAYAELLKSELRKFCPIALTNLYGSEFKQSFTPAKLNMELAYITDISDWLQTVPVIDSYNTTDNKDRIDFVIGLAKNIIEVEEERQQAPDAMDYTIYMAGIICEMMNQLPIPLVHKRDDEWTTDQLIDQLLTKILARRRDTQSSVSEQTGQNIFNFIEDHMKRHGQEIVNDKLKLEVWSARLLKELEKVIAEAPINIPRADVQDRLAKVPIPGDETVKRFNLELLFAKEITEWLNNFPLINEVNTTLVSDLAEYIAHDDTNRMDVYVTQWISQLPLDEKKEIDIPTVVQQLNMRIKKIKEGRGNEIIDMLPDVNISVKRKIERSKKHASAKANCRGCCPVYDPGRVLVQVIEEWCEKLPFEGKEEDIQKIKKIIASQLFRKIGELNGNPRFTHDQTLYRQSLSDSIDALLDDVVEMFELNGDKEVLRNELVNVVLQAKAFIEDIGVGENYKKELEDAVEKAVPNVITTTADPALELYKENVTDMFVLENFDHSNDAEKLKYQQKILSKIDTYAENSQNQNGMPVQKEKLYNDVYSALYNVETPNQEDLVDEVEEIKTKCEVENWFEKLPLKPPVGQAELLDRNHKLMLLSKRIHQYETEKAPKEQIHKEIIKLLGKFPLEPGAENNIDKFANDLVEMMEKTEKSRKCVQASDVKAKHQNDRSVLLMDEEDTDEAIAQKTKHVDKTDIWVNPEVYVNSVTESRRQKPADMIIELIENWSNNIPLPSSLTREQQQLIKNEIATKIIIKVCELNDDPRAFNSQILYNHLLGEEIEKVLAALPSTNILLQSKDAIKFQLLTAIDSVKPLIKEEKYRYQYKKDLKHTINLFIEMPTSQKTMEDQALYEKVKDDIFNDFIEYQYNKDDNNGKQFYKNKIVDVLTNYHIKNVSNQDINETRADTLLEANRLVCEMSKLPVPEEQAMKDEIEEIRMNQEVQKFLNAILSPKAHEQTKEFQNVLIKRLTKTLNDIEITGHNQENDKKIKDSINKTLHELDVKAADTKVNFFIERLTKNEKIRKAPPKRKTPTDKNISLPVNFFTNQNSCVRALSTSLPVTSTDRYTTEYQDAYGKGAVYRNVQQGLTGQHPTVTGLTEYQAAYTNPALSQLPREGPNFLTCPQQGPSMMPTSPTNALRPLMMSYPSADAADTWDQSDSGAQAMELVVDASVYGPRYKSLPRPLTQYTPAHITDSDNKELVTVRPQHSPSGPLYPLQSNRSTLDFHSGLLHLSRALGSHQLDAPLIQTQYVGPASSNKNMNAPSISNAAVQNTPPIRTSSQPRSEITRQRQPQMEQEQNEEVVDEEDDCYCDIMKRRIPCIPLLKYCEDCEKYTPVFGPMPMPPMMARTMPPMLPYIIY